MRKFMLTVLVGLLVGCGSSESASPPAATSAEAAGLPANLVPPTQPAGGARTVVDVKNTAKEGDEVVIRAKVGGQKQPVTDGRAVMTVVDAPMPSCDQMKMD